MKRFYEEWQPYFDVGFSKIEIGSLVSSQLKNSEKQISPLLTDQLKKTENEISPLLTDQFTDNFIKVSFTAHYEIITKVKTIDSRLFYITKAAKEFWTVEVLRHHLKSKLFEQQKQFPDAEALKKLMG